MRRGSLSLPLLSLYLTLALSSCCFKIIVERRPRRGSADGCRGRKEGRKRGQGRGRSPERAKGVRREGRREGGRLPRSYVHCITNQPAAAPQRASGMHWRASYANKTVLYSLKGVPRHTKRRYIRPNFDSALCDETLSCCLTFHDQLQSIFATLGSHRMEWRSKCVLMEGRDVKRTKRGDDSPLLIQAPKYQGAVGYTTTSLI